MPDTGQPSRHALNDLAGQVAPHFAGWTDGPLEIRESFPLWYLPRSALATPFARLAEVCADARQWHHQIHAGGRALFAVHSAVHGATLQFRSLSRGAFAGRLAETIGWVDRYVADPGTVRLLRIPWLPASALWLADRLKDRLVVIDLAPGLDVVERHKIYDGDLFLRRLARVPYAPFDGSDA